ncbi:MAG: hypothetical protein L0Z50_19155 [Verrucomicrobiales bacterium]|nr:hypothetical protein [Verrucomicrobiales bacterium]
MSARLFGQTSPTPIRGEHAALGYYYDHKSEIDTHIQRSVREVEKLRAQASESPIRKRLREMGKLT